MATSAAGSNPPLFLSYATADRERALAVADVLEAAGSPVWIDRRDISGGSGWAEEITHAVRSSRAVAVLCSADSLASRNVRQELQLAWDHDKPILPLLLEPVDFPDSIAYFLQGRQWVELHGRADSAWLPDVQRALSQFDLPMTSADGPEPQPARSSPLVRLPTPLTSLLGRDREVAETSTLLSDHRLVTLTGPGGVGKTRLAIEVAHRATESFPGGVHFVDLSAVSTPELVLPAISRALGVRDVPGIPLADSKAATIGDRRALLVLDNLEQVLGAAPDIATLLAHCSRLAVLGTSRAPLAVRGEHVVPVGPLQVPAAGAAMTLDDFAESPAVALFVERAEDVRAGFALTQDNAATIGAICAQLDGLPLAIELSAARMTLFSPDQLLSRLKRRLTALDAGPRDLPVRQRTLRDAIAWSHDLLSAEEQALFRRLAVFQGGCTLEAAESVSGLTGEIDVIGGLASLIEKSLIRQEQAPDAQRFVMLETIREFGWEQLVAAGEEAALLQLHADYYLAMVESTGGLLFAGERKRAQSAAEHGNVQAALQWLVQHG